MGLPAYMQTASNFSQSRSGFTNPSTAGIPQSSHTRRRNMALKSEDIGARMSRFKKNVPIQKLSADSRKSFADATAQSRTGIANAAKTMRSDYGQATSTMRGDYTKASDRIVDLYKGKGDDISNIYRQQEGKARAGLTPWRDAGERSLATLESKVAAGPGEMTKDAGYQFRLGEGMRSLDSSSAARGGALSGRAIKEAARYNQGFASNEYDKFNNRFYQSLQPLQTMAGEGRLAANKMGDYSMQAAPGIAEGQRYGAEGAERGLMFGAQGAAGASKWGAEGAAGASQWDAGQNMAALQYGANARAGVNMAEGNSMASAYSAALQGVENDRSMAIAQQDKERTFNEARRLRYVAAKEKQRKSHNQAQAYGIGGLAALRAGQMPFY